MPPLEIKKKTHTNINSCILVTLSCRNLNLTLDLRIILDPARGRVYYVCVCGVGGGVPLIRPWGGTTLAGLALGETDL